MKHSPIQLQRYVLTEASCSANPAFDAQKPYSGGSENFLVRTVPKRLEAPQSAGSSWSIELHISQQFKEGQNFPYAFKLSLVGVFHCKNGVPANHDEERFVRINGSSILYGAAREVIRSLTCRGPWGEVVLPTLSFYEQHAPPQEQTKELGKT